MILLTSLYLSGPRKHTVHVFVHTFTCLYLCLDQLGGGGPQRDNAVCVWVHGEDLWETLPAQHQHLQHKRWDTVVDSEEVNPTYCTPVAGWENESRLLTTPHMGGRGSYIGFYVVAVFSAVGVTNQRETTLVWDKETGEPLYNAIGGCILHLNEQVSLRKYFVFTHKFCNNDFKLRPSRHTIRKYFTWLMYINGASCVQIERFN